MSPKVIKPSSGRLTLDQTRQPVTYARDTVLTLKQLAAALQVEERTVQSLDLPYFYAGKRQRFLWSQVLDVLAQRAIHIQRTPSEPIKCLTSANSTLARSR